MTVWLKMFRKPYEGFSCRDTLCVNYIPSVWWHDVTKEHLVRFRLWTRVVNVAFLLCCDAVWTCWEPEFCDITMCEWTEETDSCSVGQMSCSTKWQRITTTRPSSIWPVSISCALFGWVYTLISINVVTTDQNTSRKVLKNNLEKLMNNKFWSHSLNDDITFDFYFWWH